MKGLMFNPSSDKLAPYQVAALLAFAACAALCGCAVLLLIARTHPVQGDFCRAALYISFKNLQGPGFAFFKGSGVMDYTSYVYSHWSGRWAGVGTETLLLSKTPLQSAYPWLVLTLIGTQCLFLYYAIFKLIGDSRWALYLSAVIASVYWAVMPSPRQGIFWIPGAIESQLPLSLGALLFALVLSRRPSDTKQSTLRVTIGAATLGFLIPAFHELAGGVLIIALSIITGASFLSKSPLRRTWLTVWTASVVGFVVVYAAPGNAIRMAGIPNRGNYPTLGHELLRAIDEYVLPWCLDFKHWLLACLLWLDPRVASLRTRLSGLSSPLAVSGFLLVWISLVMFATAAATYNLGTQPPGRTMDMIYGIFLILSLIHISEPTRRTPISYA